MRSAWAAAALVGGLVACGFYDAVPSPSSPFGPDIGLPDAGLPHLPDGSYALPDGGFALPDGGFQLPDGGFQLPDGGFQLPDGGFTLPDGGMLPDGGSDGGAQPPDAGCFGAACPPQVLSDSEGEPLAIALSGSDVYWVNMQPPAVRRIPKAGGTAATLLAPWSLQAPIAVDGSRLYVVASTERENVLLRSPFDPVSFQTRTRWSSGSVGISGLTHNDGTLFADTSDGLLQIDKSGQGHQVRLGPGVRRGLSASAAGLYFADLQARSIMYVSAASGHETVALLPGGLTATAVYIDPSTHAPVWIALQPETPDPNECPGGPLLVQRVVSGGFVQFTQSPGCVASLAADATHLYWLTVVPYRGSLVLRASHVSGTVEQVAETPGFGWSLALDASHAYWSERTTGRILRIPKPPPGTILDPPPN